MRKHLISAVVIVAVLGIGFLMGRPSDAGKSDGPMLAHMVYFSLKDNSPAQAEKLVAACKKYLSKHDGEVFFAAGTLAKDLKRPVNDLDFDVALHIVFANPAAQEKYQVADRHEEFIKENKDNWKKVRVFDSLVSR